MNCQDAQTQISQLADGQPSALLVAHARGCERCRPALESVLQQQVWLRRQFAEASAILLSEAPAFSEADLRQQLQNHPEPVRRGYLLWAAVAAAVLAIAGTAWWLTRPAPPKPKPAPVIVATPKKQQTPSIKPHKELAAKNGAKKGPAAKRASADDKDSKKRDSKAPKEMQAAAPTDSSSPGITTHTYTLTPQNPALNISGQVEALISDSTQGTPQATIVMSVAGLAPDTAYYLTAPNAAGEIVMIGEFRTDTEGKTDATLAFGLQAGDNAPATTTDPMQSQNTPSATSPASVSGQLPTVLVTNPQGVSTPVNIGAVSVSDANGVAFTIHSPQ